MLLALVGSLTRFRAHFEERVAEYARREFTVGERVRVLPAGWVYAFDGYFEPRHGHFFRLRELGKREPSVRSCEAGEILRLQRTDHASPRGRASSDLGRLQISPLDRLLGVRTLGNASILRTEVLLQSNRSTFEQYLDTIAVPDGAKAPLSLGEVMPWGTIADDGTLRAHDDNDGAPLCAIASSTEAVRLAALAASTDSLWVVIDGASRVQSLEKLHAIAERQHVIVLSTVADRDQIESLRENGVLTWEPDEDDLLDDREDIHPPVWDHVLDAVRISRELTLKSVTVSEDLLERAAENLTLADRSMADEVNATARDLIGKCFSALFDFSDWLLPPQPSVLNEVSGRLDTVSDRLRMVHHFLPAQVNNSLGASISALRGFLERYSIVDTPKMSALVNVIDEMERMGQRYAIAVRTPVAVQRISGVVRRQWPHADVVTVGDAPNVRDRDAILLASWSRKSVIDDLVGSCAAPDLRVLTYSYEQQWLSGYNRRREVDRRNWRIEGPDRPHLLGLPPSDRAMSLTESSGKAQNSSLDDLLSVVRMERFLGAARKGVPGIATDSADVVEARYVGFTGQTYAYLTPTHRVPMVNALVQAQRAARAAVEQVIVEDLQLGDLVLFRDVGDSDVIALIAEKMHGQRYTAARKLAEEWRPVLRRISTDPSTIHKQLRRLGLKQQLTTVTRWLRDPSLIGPQSLVDLRTIADAAKDRWLLEHYFEVFNAIRIVRGDHMAAGSRLTEILLAELPSKLSMIREHETRLELTLGDVWIVEVEEVSSDIEQRNYTEVNRLLWDSPRS